MNARKRSLRLAAALLLGASLAAFAQIPGLPSVASDLRCIIDKSLADDGIVIAFPQRDVRVDPARPIRVEMVTGTAAPRDAASARTP